MNRTIRHQLQQAYNASIEERDSVALEDWKVAERQAFLDLLLKEGRHTLLEVGAGTGLHGAFFQAAGLEVTSTDLAAGMVDACRSKGLNAHQMDLMSINFPDESFDAVFALNCLLHIPRKDLDTVLVNLRRMIRPGGLLFWGQYGGDNHEGTLPHDNYVPKRFFSLLSDESYLAAGKPYFELLDFHTVKVRRGDEKFQSGTWRKPA